MTMEVTFWGTRGSIPVSGEQFARHGGSTTCLEIQLPATDADRPDRLLIDCGTGIVDLGHVRGEEIDDALVLQTHMHWDHVQGFPFFSSFYNPEANFEFWGVDRGGCTLEEVYSDQMTEPTFPIGIETVPANLSFDSIDEQGGVELGDVAIQWTEMQHPSGSSAYRIETDAGVFVFSGDVEVELGCRQQLADFARGADVFLMDAQYFPDEYPSREGFGHSTYEHAVEVATEADVDELYLTHHDPSHDDDRLAKKASLAREHSDGGFSVANARHRLTVQVGGE